MSSFRRSLAGFGLALAALLPAHTALAECDPARYLADPTLVFTGSNPLHPLIADFDEDGKLDLAVSNSNYLGGGAASLAILRGDGSGNFGSPNVYPSAGQPHFLAAGDFNGDDILDLAMTQKTLNLLTIFLGQGTGGVGNGTFAFGGSFSTTGQPFQIVAGDYNEDGKLDLAVALNNISRLGVMLGAGNGTFGAPTLYMLNNLGRGIAQGDFNGDDILDLAATEYSSGTIAVLLGQGSGGAGNGTFASALHYAAGPEPVDIQVFDYNKDDVLDLAVASATSGGTRVLRGTGSGAFVLTASLATGNSPACAVVDVDGDSLMDILAAEHALPVGRRMHVYYGNGTGSVGDGTWTLGGTVNLSDEPYQFAIGDLNGDTHPDAVVSGFQSNRLSVLLWKCREIVPPPPDPRRPVLTRVRDVPDDEGGRVYLTWLPSSLDVPGGAVNAYRVWRQIPEEAAAKGLPSTDGSPVERITTTRTDPGPGGTILTTFWEAIATLPAQRLAGYGYTAATTEDSSAIHPARSSFYVTALTSSIDVFYDSDVATGASVDNLAPGAPANFHTANVSGGSVELAWTLNEEPDFEGYRLEKSVAADFPPGGTVVFDLADATSHTDALSGPAWYRLAAVDDDGNVSPWAPTIAVGGTVGVVDRFALGLSGLAPNPGTAREATLRFTLATGGGSARLEIFDARGRRVAAPSLAGLEAGPHALRLDRVAAFAPGVYVVRLTQDGATLERKVAFTR